jgi:hypothetical protein
MGVFAGAFALYVLQPPTDFYYWLPIFMLVGSIGANMVLALIIELTKEPDAKAIQEAKKQAG